MPFSYAYTELSEKSLRALPATGTDFDITNQAGLLAPILIPRVPGTPGNTAAQNHFVSFFQTQLPKWKIEWQNSTDRTPATGDTLVPFANLIFRRDPPWASEGDVARLTLTAHFDSKYKPDGFIGATDSAAPCAMLMYAARAIDEALTKKWEAMEKAGDAGMGLEEEKGVQVVLFDGEESFVSWTATDSLYGSRSLAESWENTPHIAMSTFRNALSSISLFVLLDLLGSTMPHVPSYFQTTHWAYKRMAACEQRLRALGLLESTQGTTPFLPDAEKTADAFNRGYVEDDHVPFMARGVDILHIIPTPFPGVWHTMDDDGEHLDMPTVRDWARIVAAFTAEWMELEGYLPGKQEKAKREAKTEL